MSVASVTPNGWPRGAGYAHGTVAAGRIVCTAGQIGWDPLTQRIVSDDFAAQVDQALANVMAVLGAAGAAAPDIVRLTWYITDRDAYHAALAGIGAAYRNRIGRHYPAMAVIVVAGLLEPRALVEVEATAVIPA